LIYFDDEPSTGGGYEDAFSVQIWDPDGIPRRIVVRHRGRFDRVAIMLEEVRDGITGRLIRYDDAHGRFHRHEPGWPEPLPTIAAFLDDVPARQRAAAAILEVKVRYTLWETAVFGEKGAELK
jgi:hypothetical protein